MGKIVFCTVDAFTTSPFSGNPAAVCLLEEDLDDELKKKIASEVNLSETAFLTRVDGSDFKSGNEFGLRWFTPTNEVPLCGHGTIAAATTLFGVAGNENPFLKFNTLSGRLEARRRGGRVVLDLPQHPPEPCEGRFQQLVQELAEGHPVKDVMISPPMKYLLLTFDETVTREDIERLKPNMNRLVELEQSGDVKGVIVSAATGGTSKYDFVSRHFDPWQGVPEDPVTGSTHTVLAPYWAPRLGSTTLKARQCSARGGDLWMNLKEDGRMDLEGEAVVMLNGTIHVQQD